MTTDDEDMRVSFLRRVSQASSEACRLQFLYHDVCWYEAQRQHDRWLPTAAAAYLEQITLDSYFTGLCRFGAHQSTGELSVLANDSSHGLIVFLF